MVDVEQGLLQVLHLEAVLGLVVLLEGGEPLGGEVGGGVEVVADLRHVEVLRLVAVAVPGHHHRVGEEGAGELEARAGLVGEDLQCAKKNEV